MQNGTATVENSMRFLRKLKIELPYDPANPLLGIYIKELKSGSQSSICTPIFVAALFTIAKIGNNLNTQWEVNGVGDMVYNGVLFSLKKEGNSANVMTWMNLEEIVLREITGHRRANIAWFHFHELSKIVELMEARDRIVAAQFGGRWKRKVANQWV